MLLSKKIVLERLLFMIKLLQTDMSNAQIRKAFVLKYSCAESTARMYFRRAYQCYKLSFHLQAIELIEQAARSGLDVLTLRKIGKQAKASKPTAPQPVVLPGPNNQSNYITD